MNTDTVYVDVPAPRGRVLRFRDMTLEAGAKYVVKDFINAGEAAALYAVPKAAKTLYAMHLGLDVANGRPHGGRRTRSGLVVHVALESVGAIMGRAVAYRQASGETDAPYVVLDWSLDLFDAVSREHLAAKIRELEAEYQLPLVLMIVDTLARAMPGRDENSKDLGDAIAYAHDLVRDNFAEAAALVVHHAGKDASRGARGHSSLYGNVDGIFRIENSDGRRVVSIDVHRNAPQGEVIAAFEVEGVTIGEDADGDPITSCVLRWTDTPAERPKGGLTPTERMGLDTLREAIRLHGEYPPSEVFQRNRLSGGERVVQEEFWRDIYYRRRTSADDTPEARKKGFQRARDKLQMSRLMQADAGFYWLSGPSGQPGHNGTKP